jgi:short-subunit dehydrogenase
VFTSNSQPTTHNILKHCYVTGGSAGLGLALALLLTKKGADVSIVARNEERLQKALQEMEVRVYNLRSTSKD